MDPRGKTLYSLVQSSVILMKKRDVEALDSRLESGMICGIPDLESFAQGLQKEYSAIKAALTLPSRNGPVEGRSLDSNR